MKHSRQFIVLVLLAAGASACTTTRTVHTPARTVTTTATVTASAAPAARTTVTARSTTTTTVTVAPPAPVPDAFVGQVVDASGTRFTAPSTPSVKVYRNYDPAHCYGLGDAGFTAQCTKVSSQLGTAIGVVEINKSQERDFVYTVHGTQASLALHSQRTLLPSTRYGTFYYNSGATRATLGDLALDNTPKLIFYTPVTSAAYVDAFQSVDVVEASGRVVIHHDLDSGVASRAFGGGLEVWIPQGSVVEHEIIQWQSGAWRVTTASVVDKDSIPSNHNIF